FFEDNVDCDDELPLEDQLGILTSCDAYRQTLLADLSPMGQYGDVSGTDLLSVFTETNFLNKGTLSITHNWRNPVFPYKDEDGSNFTITITTDGTTYLPEILDELDHTDLIPNTNPNQYLARPEQLADLTVFQSIWKPYWAESLLEYHPEYCYLSMMEEVCNKTKNIGGNPYSSEHYDG